MNCSCTKYPVPLNILTVITKPLDFSRPPDKSSQSDVFSVLAVDPNQTVDTMDVGTLKTPIPNVVFTGHFCLGRCSNLYVLNLVRNRVLNSCKIWSTTQLKTPHPHPHSHTLSVYTVCLLWEEGRGEVREKVEGQQYTSIVPSSMGAAVHKLG
jgi:hypothetical protein